MPDLGKSLKWPKEVPRPLKSVDPLIHNIFIRWRAFKILSKYPRESWPEMHLKITALELLKGKRMQWGIQRYNSFLTNLYIIKPRYSEQVRLTLFVHYIE